MFVKLVCVCVCVCVWGTYIHNKMDFFQKTKDYQ